MTTETNDPAAIEAAHAAHHARPDGTCCSCEWGAKSFPFYERKDCEPYRLARQTSSVKTLIREA